MTATRVGFVGLGSQGGPMARRIVDAGFDTRLWARRPESLEAFGDTSAHTASTMRELGELSDVLCVCVVNDADVDDVLRGPAGALAGMAAGAVVVIHSTTHPDTCRRLQSDFPDVRVVDAPVSGGGGRAAEGTLLVMAGGAAADLELVRPILATYADPLLHLGSLGSGQEAKLLNNTLFAAQLALVADAFAMAADRGLDLAGLDAVLRDGSSRSYAAEVLAFADHRLETMGGYAGPLLAKDVAILDSLTTPWKSLLLDVAHAALQGMGVAAD